MPLLQPFKLGPAHLFVKRSCVVRYPAPAAQWRHFSRNSEMWPFGKILKSIMITPCFRE